MKKEEKLERRKKQYKQGPQLSLSSHSSDNQNANIEKKILGNKQRIKEILSSKRRKSFQVFEESFDEEEEFDLGELNNQMNSLIEEVQILSLNHRNNVENSQIEQKLDEIFTSFQNLLSTKNNKKFQVVCDRIFQGEGNLLNLFEYLLFHSKKNKLKNKVGWAIANLSSSTTHQHINYLITKFLSDMITILLDKLTSTKLKESSLWFIANIAACCPECRKNLIFYSFDNFRNSLSQFNNLNNNMNNNMNNNNMDNNFNFLNDEQWKSLKGDYFIISILSKYLSPLQSFLSAPHPINLFVFFLLIFFFHYSF